MRDLSSAIEALAEEMEKAGRAARVPPVWIDRLRAILAECGEPDLEDASLPRMPTSKRTVTLHEEPAETAKERIIRIINQSVEEWFAGEPSGGGSNLPAPKRWKCKDGRCVCDWDGDRITWFNPSCPVHTGNASVTCTDDPVEEAK
jgi:hypothetical protein